MRVLCLAMILGCSSGGRDDDYKTRDAIERAGRVQAKLDTDLKKQLDYWGKNPGDASKALAFPVQKAGAKCGPSELRVLYNPYRDLIRITFFHRDSLDEEVRTLSINGKKLWTKPGKFEGMNLTMDFGADEKAKQLEKTKDEHYPRRSVVFDELTKKQAALFPGDQDISIEVTAESMIGKRVDDKTFDYERYTHPAFRIKLHVFTAEMAAAIGAHSTKVQAAHVPVHVLGFWKSDVDSMRGVEHEKVTPVVKRYDGLLAEATAKVAAAGAMPHAQHVKALVVEPVKPCEAK